MSKSAVQLGVWSLSPVHLSLCAGCKAVRLTGCGPKCSPAFACLPPIHLFISYYESSYKPGPVLGMLLMRATGLLLSWSLSSSRGDRLKKILRINWFSLFPAPCERARAQSGERPGPLILDFVLLSLSV